MNIIFTAAGRGTRFNGYSKPFFKAAGRTLLEWSVGSLKLDGSYWVIGNENWTYEEIRDTKEIFKRLGLEYQLELVSGAPGQAAHALIVAEKLDPNEPLLICNCDQYTPWNHKKFQDFLDNSDLDGIVTTYHHGDFAVGSKSKYSHILLKDGVGVELVEKFAISDISLNGLFFFRRCGDFVSGANQLIADTLTGESYVSLVYNYLIADGKRVGIYEMETDEFVSLGSLDEVVKNLSKL